MSETDERKIGMKWVDVNRENLANVAAIADRLKDVEIFVACLEISLGHDVSKVARIRSLREDWSLGVSLTRTSVCNVVDVPMIELDLGYRTVFLLIPKTRENLLECKKIAVEKGSRIPEYYSADFEKLRSGE